MGTGPFYDARNALDLLQMGDWWYLITDGVFSCVDTGIPHGEESGRTLDRTGG